MEWGMKNRLSRLIQTDGKALFLPIDHGYFQGPTHMLEKPGETIKPLVQYADAIMLTRGVLRNCIDPALPKPVILRVSGAATVVGEDYGIPVMAVTAVGKELEKREARYLALCCRVAAEIGARVVKTYYCPEKFDKIVE